MADLSPASQGAPGDNPAQAPDDSALRTPHSALRGPWHPATWLALIRGRPLIPVIVLLTVVFIFLTAIVLRADLQPTSWDIAITAWVQYLPAEPFGFIFRLVSDPGYWPWNTIMAAGIALVMLLWRWLPEAVFTALAGVGGYTAAIVKELVDRPRPTPDFARISFEHSGFSFPSGHVTSYTILFGFLFYLAYTLLPRKHPFRWAVLIVCGILIVLVAPSRIWLGAHWASDTIAGHALGFAYLLVLIELYRAWQKRHPTPDVAAGPGL